MDSIIVQPTFQEVIQDSTGDSGTFWILRELKDNDISEEYEIEINPDGTFKSDNAQLSRTSDYSKYKLTIGNNTYLLQASLNQYKCPLLQVTAVASNDKHIVVGDSEGSIYIIDRSTHNITLSLPNAHYSDITCLGIFPSGKVVISASLDMRIKIWSMADGSNPRTMSGHAADITGINLLGYTGRNFLSSSSDGTVKLWEIGSSSILHTFKRIVKLDDPVTCIYSTKSEPEPGLPQKSNGLDFETNGVYLYVGYQSGNIQQFNVHERTQTSVKYNEIGENVAVTSIVKYKDVLIAGYSNGILKAYGKLCERQFDAASPVVNIAVEDKENGRLVVNAGGNVFTINLETFTTDHYLVGVERVNALACSSGSIVTGGKEGIVAYRY